MRTQLLTLLTLVLAFSAFAAPKTKSLSPLPTIWKQELNRYNIVWNTQSQGSSESMPLSGCNLGLNVWVEKGELFFLMASPNCYTEKAMQTKLGLVRLQFSADIFNQGFEQQLNLEKSEMLITGKTAAGAPVALKLWCPMSSPVIHVEMTSGAPVSVAASYETWADFNVKAVGNDILWSRRLPDANALRLTEIKDQGVEDLATHVLDPLSGLTEGGRMSAEGFVIMGTRGGVFNSLKTNALTMKSKSPIQKMDLCIAVRNEQDKSLDAWEINLANDLKQGKKNAVADKTATVAWWTEFWNRSYININPGAVEKDKAWLLGRNYQLFRYQLAANTSGRFMTLFNGGMFVCENNPDARSWDFCEAMAQNQRAMAWPMLKSGDFDILKVSLDFYKERTELRRLHTTKFFGVDGVTYPEGMGVFGLDCLGAESDGRCHYGHLKYHYTSGMEFALLMLEYGRFTGKDIKQYIEPAWGTITYYDEYYQKTYQKKEGKPLDENGHLVLYPSAGRETFQGCTNSTDAICGLEALAQALLDLPSQYLSNEKRNYLKEFLKRLPPLAMAEKDGHQYVAPAKSFEGTFINGNMEFSNMDICFPFNHFFLGRPDKGAGIELVNNTWEYGAVSRSAQCQLQCWYSTIAYFARLGRTGEAAAGAINKMVMAPSLRFPAFWTNYGFCQAPDTDHGGTAMTGLQEMLMQTDGKRILLGPAWPLEWNCQFKLNAPYQTVVEGHVSDGKIVADKVTPESRRKDIEIFTLQKLPPPPISQNKLARASSEWPGGGYPANKAIDGDPASRWAASYTEKKDWWLEIDLGATTQISRAFINENNVRTKKFALEVKQNDGSWKTIIAGDGIGPNKELKFNSVQGQIFRLLIMEASDTPTLEEVELFVK